MNTLATSALRRVDRAASTRARPAPQVDQEQQYERDHQTDERSTDNTGGCGPEPPNSGLSKTALSQMQQARR
jgi:hypothetical protein